MNPQNAMEWNKKAYEYEKQGNVSEALRCIEEAVKIQPKSEDYLLHKSTVLEKAERLQEALEIYHHVMTVIPQSTKGYIGVVRCLNKLGRNEEIAAYDEEIRMRYKPETSHFTGEFKMGEKKLTEEQKRELRKTFGPFSDRELGGMMDYLSGYEQKQKENAEKAKILLGEDYVKKLLEENPNAMQSYHFSEPYGSMSLEELKRLRNIDQKEKPISDKDRLALKQAFGDSLYNYLENQGAAFTLKALEKRLESFIEDPNERKYGRENLEEVLNKLRVNGRINSSQHNGVTHYFVPKQPPRSTNQFSSSLKKPSKMLKRLRKSAEKDEYYTLLRQKTKQKRQNVIEFFDEGNRFGLVGLFDKAIKYHKKAVDIDPTFADGWCNLGADYLSIGDLNNALSCFNNAIKLDPQNKKTWDNRGLVLIKQNKFDEAVKCFNASLKIDINNPIAKQNREYALNQLKKTDFAAGFMRDFMEPSPEEIQAATKNLSSTQTIINQQEIERLEAEAEKLIYDGDFEDVIVLCDNLLAKAPYSSMGWFWKGKALSALARDEEAVNCYAKSYDLNNWITSQSNYFYAKSRLRGKSSKDTMRKMDKPPKSSLPMQGADSWNAQGAYAQTLGQFEVALYCFEQTLKFNQEHNLAKRNIDRVSQLLKKEGYL